MEEQGLELFPSPPVDGHLRLETVGSTSADGAEGYGNTFLDLAGIFFFALNSCTEGRNYGLGDGRRSVLRKQKLWTSRVFAVQFE